MCHSIAPCIAQTCSPFQQTSYMEPQYTHERRHASSSINTTTRFFPSRFPGLGSLLHPIVSPEHGLTIFAMHSRGRITASVLPCCVARGGVEESPSGSPPHLIAYIPAGVSCIADELRNPICLCGDDFNSFATEH